jgi:hypothetical protein
LITVVHTVYCEDAKRPARRASELKFTPGREHVAGHCLYLTVKLRRAIAREGCLTLGQVQGATYHKGAGLGVCTFCHLLL